MHYIERCASLFMHLTCTPRELMVIPDYYYTYKYRIYPNRSSRCLFPINDFNLDLYEPFLHFTQVFIYFRALNPCVSLSPDIYMGLAFIWISMAIVEDQIGKVKYL